MTAKEKCLVYLELMNFISESNLNLKSSSKKDHSGIPLAQASTCGYFPFELAGNETGTTEWFSELYSAFQQQIGHAEKSNAFIGIDTNELHTLPQTYLRLFGKIIAAPDVDDLYVVKNIWVNSNEVVPQEYCNRIPENNVLFSTTVAIGLYTYNEPRPYFHDFSNFYSLYVVHLPCGAILAKTHESRQCVFSSIAEYQAYLNSISSANEFTHCFS